MSQTDDKTKGSEKPKPPKPDKAELEAAIADKQKTLATNQIIQK